MEIPEDASEGDVASDAGDVGEEGDEGDEGDAEPEAKLEEIAARDNAHTEIESLKRRRAPVMNSSLMLRWSEAEMQRMQGEEQSLELEYRQRRAKLSRQRAKLQQLMREFMQKQALPASKLDLSNA
jgi:hypothetical protein